MDYAVRRFARLAGLWIARTATRNLPRADIITRIAFAIVSVGFAEVVRAQESTPGISLHEQYAHPFPKAFVPKGAISWNGLLIVWGAGGWARIKNQDFAFVKTELGLPTAAEILHDTLVIHTSQPAFRYQYKLDGQLIRTDPSHEDSTLFSSSGIAFTWTSVNGTTLIQTYRGRRTIAEYLGRVRDLAVSDSSLIYLLPWGRPFIVVAVKNGISTPLRDVRVAQVARDGSWESGPLVRVNRCWLRTLIDLRSDRRVVALYREDLTFLRATVVDSPITFIGSVNASIFAVRNIQGFELVEYGYTWTENTKELCAN
jgi:hypothetical protein